MQLPHKPWSWWVSVLLNPNTFQVLGYFLICGWGTMWPELGATLLLGIIPIAGYLYYTRRVLHKSDPLTVSRRERMVPFFINIGCLLLALFILPRIAFWGVDKAALPVYMLFEVSGFYITFLLWVNILALVVTLWHKTSLHVIAPTALVYLSIEEFYRGNIWADISELDLPLGVLALWLIPLAIALARYQERAHTRLQLASAFALGILATASYFYLEIYLWILL